MEIRKSSLVDLKEILAIYAQARQFMAENGNPDQWGSKHPPESLIKQDITTGYSYICLESGRILGVFYFAVAADPTYAKIYAGNWLNESPYGVIHRMASAGGKKGAASFCLDWCLAQCGNLRIDTHQNNLPMQNLLKKNGFARCGIIHLENGEERIAFQKISE